MRERVGLIIGILMEKACIPIPVEDIINGNKFGRTLKFKR